MLAVAWLCAPTWGQPVPAPGTIALGNPEVSLMVREQLLQHLPTPLAEQSLNWGKQRPVACGLKWHKGKLGLLKPELQHKLENDGVWRQVRVEIDRPAETLVLVLTPITPIDAERSTFDAYLFCNVRVNFQQQIWESGVRLFSGETRAHLRVALRLRCEMTLKLEKGKSWLPDMVFRFRVADAQVFYDNFVVDHTAGVGGDLAHILGDAVHDCLKVWRPGLEGELLRKADAAIVKAANGREVRFSPTAALGWKK